MSGYSESSEIVNDKGLLFATNAYHIIVLIGIIISNGALVIKIIRQKHFLYIPKYLLLISLAVGDIFLALFALVIHGKIMFQSRFEGCRILFFYRVYINYLINFVYGIGLVVLSAEFVYRRRSKKPRTTTHFDLILSFLISSVPWLLGLFIVLPLTMAGVDLDICRRSYTFERINAQVVVSMILPTCLAVIAALVVVWDKKDRGYVQPLEITSGDQTLAGGQGTDDVVVQPVQQDAVNVPAYNANPPYYPPENPFYDAPENPPYPIQNPPHEGYVDNSWNVNDLTTVVDDNIPMIPSTSAIYPEQQKILSLALIFFFLVTPLAVYYLVALNCNLSSSALTNIAFGQVLMWLMLLRPFLTAVVTSQTTYLTQI